MSIDGLNLKQLDLEGSTDKESPLLSLVQSAVNYRLNKVAST